jgi:hypothetical protein
MENKQPSISEEATAALQHLHTKLIGVIQRYLTIKREIEFGDNVNITFADETITHLQKDGDAIFVVTSDNIHGEVSKYQLCDQGTVAIQDLIWMVEQIEDLVPCLGASQEGD